MKKTAFTLVELMIVIAIIAFLSMIAIPNLTAFLAKSKRTEAYINLHSLYAAQKAYYAEHGGYSTSLNGPNSIGWKPSGYKGGGKKEKFYYTYGFPGSEGKNHFTGKLETPASFLTKGNANKNGFIAVAAGHINGKNAPDVITIDQDNTITVVEDSLA